MTVAELIAELRKRPPGAQVLVDYDGVLREPVIDDERKWRHGHAGNVIITGGEDAAP